MKICVIGAGAIGGFMGALLARKGYDVTLVARGAHLSAIKERGLKIIRRDEEMVVTDVAATDDMSQIGPQDVVLLALKSHQIAAVLDQLPGVMGPDTVMVTLQNGIPWWYFQKLGGEYEGRAVESVDPGGVLARAINPDRLLGCIAYPATVITQPGVIRHIEGMRFPIGELDGSHSPRVETVSGALTDAGFKSPILDDIRSEIWLKLWGNLSFNPVSALTHATLEGICQYPISRELIATMMTEAKEIGEKLGARFRVTLERRIEGAEQVGKHKTSMLQDVEAGKPMEIEGMLGAVIELGEMTHTPIPSLKAIYACVSLLNHTLQQERLFLKGQISDA